MSPIRSSERPTCWTWGHIVKSFVIGSSACLEIIWKAINWPRVNSPFITMWPPYQSIPIEIKTWTILLKPLITRLNFRFSKVVRTYLARRFSHLLVNCGSTANALMVSILVIDSTMKALFIAPVRQTASILRLMIGTAQIFCATYNGIVMSAISVNGTEYHSMKPTKTIEKMTSSTVMSPEPVRNPRTWLNAPTRMRVSPTRRLSK